ncbi:MAG: hypothetical protein E7319_01315 [Clostridiales bacterium]|nr:hypothetical protein [Clostridiales bacterium]
MKPETLWLIAGLAGTVGVLTCLWGMQNKKSGLSTRLTALDEHFQLPDLRFTYRAEQVFATLEGVGDEGKKLLMRLWTLDFALIASMFAMMAVVTNNVVEMAWLSAVMLAANCLRGAADLIENVLLMIVCAGYPRKKRAFAANAAGAATAVKWVSAVLWVAGMFLSLFLRGWKM